MTVARTDAPDALLARARAGDEAAWAVLYRELAPALLGYLRVRGAADPEDLLGEVFLHVARGIAGFEGTASGFRSWVFMIATSRLHDERRRRQRRPVESLDQEAVGRPAPEVDVEADGIRQVVLDEVRGLLAVLTSDQRAVVELRVFGGLTSEEAGLVLGKPTGAVKALYRRAIGALRRHLDRGDGADSLFPPELVLSGARGTPGAPRARRDGPVPLRGAAAVTGAR